MTHGHISGVPVGSRFRNRRSLYDAGVHRDIRRGICGSSSRGLGAESIVLSGGYEDDLDLGELIYYTGSGGRDRSGKQVSDQTMAGLNGSLALNADTALPVRLIRAVTQEFEFSGLYLVEDAYLTKGRSGYLIAQYRLRSAEDLSGIGGVHLNLPDRRRSMHYRLIRDGAVPVVVKKLYDFACQICGVRLETLGGPYAEGAHLVPLGGGADGPDDITNVLCLCPNHHVLLDHGAMYFDDEWVVRDREGSFVGVLTVHPEHGLNVAFAQRHRALMGFA